MSKSRLWRVWTSTGVPTRNCAGIFQSKRWARARPYWNLQVCSPRRTALCIGLQDPFGLRFFPLSLHLPSGQRVAKRLRPQARIGANRPSGRLLGGDKRGARSVPNPITTPKAAPTLPNAGKHYLCFRRLKRTRHKTFPLRGYRLARPPYLSKPDRMGRTRTPKRLFLPPYTAHSFSARRKRMGGSSPPFPLPGGENPSPQALPAYPGGHYGTAS